MIDLSKIPTRAWKRPLTETEAGLAIVATLKALGTAPILSVRTVAGMALEPGIVTSCLDCNAKKEWIRVVGPEAKLPLGPFFDDSFAWSEAIRFLRGAGFLVEDLGARTWGPGPGIDRFETGGWPDGRVSVAIEACRRRGDDLGVGAEKVAEGGR